MVAPGPAFGSGHDNVAQKYGLPKTTPASYARYPAALPGMPAVNPSMLAANVDRDRAIDVLRAGFAEGRLTKEEHDDRVSRVYASRTYGELAALTADLPAGPLPYPAGFMPPVAAPVPVLTSQTNPMAIAGLVLGLGTVALAMLIFMLVAVTSARSGMVIIHQGPVPGKP